MKRKYIKIGLAVCLTAALQAVDAQNTLLVYTRYPTQLNFIDAFNKVLPKKAMWNEKDGGFVLNYDELDNTFISAEQSANFKLSNNSQLTKLIALQANDKISLQKCFTSEKYCCEQLNDKQKKGTEKILAVAVMKKSADKNLPVVFQDAIKKEISSMNDMSVAWTTLSAIKEVYLVDVNTLDIVWKKNDFAGDNIEYQDIAGELTKPMEMNHTYQFGIILASDTDNKYTFDFNLKDLAFQSLDYHFVSDEVVKIGWATDKKIANISLLESASNKNLWQSTDYSASEFALSSEASLKGKVQPGVEYKLNIRLDNGSTHDYNFMVLLDSSDSEALKALLE